MWTLVKQLTSVEGIGKCVVQVIKDINSIVTLTPFICRLLIVSFIYFITGTIVTDLIAGRKWTVRNSLSFSGTAKRSKIGSTTWMCILSRKRWFNTWSTVSGSSRRVKAKLKAKERLQRSKRIRLEKCESESERTMKHRSAKVNRLGEKKRTLIWWISNI